MGIIRKIAGLFSGLFGIGFVALAFITLLPATASKLNMLDYHSVCSFAPVSTIILFSFSIVFVLLGLRILKSSRAQKRMYLKVLESSPANKKEHRRLNDFGD